MEKMIHELKETKNKLERVSREKEALKKAIWDMLNYANIYVLILDFKMNILLINHSLSIKLGFNDEKEPIGRCWLDFIKEEDREHILAIHTILTDDIETNRYREVTSSIVSLTGEEILVKWFNFKVNSIYHLMCSFGIPKTTPEITEESIRSYYQDILDKDRTMILALRDSVTKDLKIDDICEMSEE